MGLLIAAIALIASLVPPPAHASGRRPASAKATPQNLYVAPAGMTIQAFAQDGPLLAWFAPATTKAACNSVRVLSLANGGQIRLPDQTATAHNVTCRWDVAPPVNLAIAGSDVLWTLREKQAPVQFDYVLGAGIADTRERRFQEVAHARRGAGLWLGGVAGDSRTGTDPISTLVYGTTAVQFVDEIACLSGGSCDMKIAGGGVYRVVGRKQPQLVPNTEAAVQVAVSGSSVAYVPAAKAGANGVPVAAADLPVELLDVRTGRRIAEVSPQGTPLAIALAPQMLVMLERAAAGGLTLDWYSTTTGEVVGSVAVPANTLPELSANDQQAVFRIGRFIHVLTYATGHSRTVAETVGTPIGVSLEGNRLAWAENVKGRGRIRALYLNGRG